MQKLRLGVFAAILIALVCSPALAGPQDSLRKLTAGMWAFQAQNKEGLPPCPLTEDEAKELTAWMTSEYQKQGQQLAPEQAGMMAGLLAGYAAATDVPENTLRHCTEVAQTGRESYMVMHSCIKIELNAKKHTGQ